MHIYPLPADRCFMVVHSLVESRPHDSADRPTCAGDDTRFRDTQGLIHQCAHCRRIQRTREPDHWDWVPEWVRKCPVGTSHTLCPVCDLYFYPTPDNAPT